MSGHNTLTKNIQRRREELSDTEKLTLLKAATIGAEEELHRKYGYRIPKSKVDLSGASPEELEKEWMTRDAMTRYVRFRLGEEEFDPGNWIAPPKEVFDIKDYTVGENIFGVEADSPEQVKAFATKYSNKNWTKEEIEELIRNPSKFPPKIEKLAVKRDYYLQLAERLHDRFVKARDKSIDEVGSRKFNDAILARARV